MTLPVAAARAPRLGLPDHVVSQLLASVTSGEHPPGSRLPAEAELAARANVSRLTLREAVKILRDKGVLRVEQGRGTFVNAADRWSPLDPELLASRTSMPGGRGEVLVEQLIEARRVVEVGIAGLAAQRRTPADLERLTGILEQMRSTHEQADVPAFSAADGDFHDAVLQAAGNAFLTALFEPIRALVRQVRVTTSVEPRMREAAIRAHTAILDAVALGDRAAACRATQAHLDDTHRVAVEVHVERDLAVPLPAGRARHRTHTPTSSSRLRIKQARDQEEL